MDLADEAWRWAERMRRMDVGLAVRGMSLCIGVSGCRGVGVSGEQSRRAEAITTTEAPLARAAQATERARLHQLLWQLDPRREGDRRAAAGLLRRLHRRQPCQAHRQAYGHLSGRSLPRASRPPLPSPLPSRVPPLHALLSRLEAVLGSLSPVR